MKLDTQHLRSYHRITPARECVLKRLLIAKLEDMNHSHRGVCIETRAILVIWELLNHSRRGVRIEIEWLERLEESNRSRKGVSSNMKKARIKFSLFYMSKSYFISNILR